MHTAGLLPRLLIAGLLTASVSAWGESSVALYYGPHPPLSELKSFDVIVVDPDQPGVNPATYQRTDSALFAYVSVGEVRAEKPYFHKMPPSWLHGDNPDWGSKIVDQSSADWPRFFAEEIVGPLWKKGYRGFFLDTLDSYHYMAQGRDDIARQENGIKAAIHEVKRRWPEARLIVNRGFELLPDIHQDVWMVAAESLYQAWDAHTKNFVNVLPDDRVWLEAQLRKAQKDYHLPVLVIDYLPPKQRQLARETARKIHDEGFIPYVSTPELDAVGVGDIEPVPRKVMIIYSPHEADDVAYTEALRFLGMPLAYLGLEVEFHSVDDPLPDFPLRGRYAGIVTWLNDESEDRQTYSRWLFKQMNQGVPVAVFSHFGIGSDMAFLSDLGLSIVDEPTTGVLSVQQADPMMGFELPLRTNPYGLFPVVLSGDGQPLLTLTSASHRRYTPAAITPWGGYLLYPYTISELGNLDASDRWYVNPLSFLIAALKLDTSIPVPDVTTEMGRRLLMVHIDGDGFASKAERPGYPFAGQVLLNDVLKKYQVPTTVSIIEGEVGQQGLYPQDSPALESIARDIFALPWVQLASHTYSHPFRWSETQQHGTQGNQPKAAEANSLPLKNYAFTLKREIDGSANYIDTRLAPPGKHTRILFWSGDCVPTEAALAEVSNYGLLNFNGGDTIITRSRNSWTNMAGLGLNRGDYFQVFAPDQNENVYTNLWTGPFYGYERVIETFELTESPYRFKPIDIYYHFYATTKTASLNALYKVYNWALQQPVNVIYVSDYINKVMDFNSYAVARTAHGFRLRGDGALRTVRLPVASLGPNLVNSHGVAGVATGPNARYISLVNGNADLVFAGNPASAPFIESANARLTHFEQTSSGIRFGLAGYLPLRLTLSQKSTCRFFDGDKQVNSSSHEHEQYQYELPEPESTSLRLDCGA
jgi:uncharacterized protein (TIGR01370 family)